MTARILKTDPPAPEGGLRTLGPGGQEAAGGQHAFEHLPDGGNAIPWSKVLGSGTTIPTPTPAFANLYFFNSATQKFYQCDDAGANWVQILTGATTSGPPQQPDVNVPLWFDVTDYGAKTNGNDNGRVTTNAVVAAHQAAVDNGGGVVFFPPGTYLMTTAPSVITAEPNLTGEITFRGSGRGITTLRLGTGVAGAATLTTQLAGAEPKAVPQGNTYWPRGNTNPIESGYDAAFENETRESDWREIQPTDTNTLATAWVTDFTNFLNAARANGRKMRLRIWTSCSKAVNAPDTGCPLWLLATAGTFKHYNSGPSAGGTVKTIPRFWDSNFVTAYDNLIRLIAAQFDTHPAFLDCYIDLGGLVFQEPDIRDVFGIAPTTDGAKNRAELVGGGIGWDGTTIAPPGAGYTDALCKAAQKAAIDSHAQYLLHTCSTRDFNAFATCTDYNTYSDSDGWQGGDHTMPNTRELVEYYVAKLGRRAVLQNNSVTGTRFLWSGGSVGNGVPSIDPNSSQGYGTLMQMLLDQDTVRVFQTGTGGSTDPVTVNSAREGVVVALQANGMEPSVKTGVYPSDAPSMITWNARLKANPLPALPNNDLTYTAKTLGTTGNSVTVRYVVAGNNTALSVSVASSAITVNLATNSSGVATSLASDVKAAIAASTPANALVTVTYPTNSDGTGVVSALSAKSLSGGYGITLCSVFMGNDYTITGTPEYRNYAFEDFTIDGTGAGVDTHGYLVHYSPNTAGNPVFNCGRHEFRRIDSTNWGHAGFDRNMLNVTMLRADPIQTAPVTYCKNWTVQDCYAGVSGGGGLGGIALVGFVGGASTSKTSAGLFQAGPLFTGNISNPANFVVDQLHITNFTHDTGVLGTTSGDSYGILLGGDGVTKHARIKNCRLTGSEDVEIEVDNGVDIDIDGCVMGNHHGNAVLILPFGGMFEGREADIRVRNCKVQWDGVAEGNASTWTSLGNAYTINSRYGPVMNGNVLFENCSATLKGQWVNSVTVFQIGSCRQATLRNCSSHDLAGPVPNDGSKVMTHLKIQNNGRRMTANVENFSVHDEYTVDNTQLVCNRVLVTSAQGLRLNLHGMTTNTNVNWINAGTHVTNEVDLGTSGAAGSSVAQPFAADTLDAALGTGGCCAFDSGASNQYTYDATNDRYDLSAGTPALTTEKRAIYIASSLDTTIGNLIGRVIDGCQYAKFTPGTTLTAYKAGSIFKRKSYDATTYAEAYIYDNGTNSYLCLDRVLAGVRGTLLPSGTVPGANGVAGSMTRVQFNATPPAETSGYGILLETRLTTGTAHWPRVTVSGDTVYAEHFTAAPGNQVTRPDTTGAYATVALTGTDITNYGHVQNGYWGFCHIPISANAQLDDLTHQRLNVISGEISGLTPQIQHARGAVGIKYTPNGGAGLVRAEAEMVVRDSNFTNLGSATNSPAEFSLTTDPAFTPRRRGITYIAAQAAVTITPTTPSGSTVFDWQNTTGCMGTLFITAGTVTLIEMSKDGTTYRTTGLITGAMRVPPGWHARVTYTASPTMIFEKED